MKLVTDTNILVRCSRGRAVRHVVALRERGVALLTTDRNAEELVGVLQGVFGLSEPDALAETARVLRPFEVVDANDYGHFAPASRARLAPAGQSDWPALAAALALDGAIWSEDTDFFGVGVPVWSTVNLAHVEGASA